MYVYVYAYILLNKILLVCIMLLMHVFNDDHLVLNKQLMYSFLEETISPNQHSLSTVVF